jgi:hypothetical protein
MLRGDLMPTAFPNLAGAWHSAGGACAIAQDASNNLTLTNETGQSSPGSFQDATLVVAAAWGNLVGTLSGAAPNLVINWANGTTWTEGAPPAPTALPIRYGYGAPAAPLFWSLEHLATTKRLDFKTGQLSSAPQWLVQPLSEDTGPDAGGYSTNFPVLAAGALPDGLYCVRIHLRTNPTNPADWSMKAVGWMGVTFANGLAVA